MAVDLRLVENYDGGDVVLIGNDFELINGWQNMPYLAMFGGNVKEDTTGPKVPNQQSFDFWGNYLLFPDQQKLWYNSLTERLLNTTELNTRTRQEIEDNVRQDLSFMNDFAVVTVFVSLVGIDKLRISIIIQEPGNLQSNEFTYIWDSTQQELSIPESVYPAVGQGIALNNILDFGL